MRIQPVRELLLWATQNYQWFKKMMGLWLVEPLGASHLAQQLKSRDQIKHIWVRAGLWFRAPCSLYYLRIKHTADDFICGRLYWLPHDNAAGYLFLKKWLTVPWQWFSRLRCDRTGEHLDEAHLIFFFFGKPVREKVPVGLNLTSLEEVNTVWCDPERGAGGCAVWGGGEEERSNHSDNIWCREEVNLVMRSPSERKQAEDHRHVSLSRSLSQSCVYWHPLHLSEPDRTWV